MNAIRPLTFLAGVALLGLGGSLIARSISGRDDAEDIGEHNPDACVPYGDGSRIETVLTIDRPAAELYAYWRDLRNLPTIMSHLSSIEVIDELRSRWTATGLANVSATWDAEIIDDTPGRRIAWRSIGGTVPNAGSVAFGDVPEGSGTQLHVEIEWAPPGGRLGRSFANLFGGDPGAIVHGDLRRFKTAMESGEPAL